MKLTNILRGTQIAYNAIQSIQGLTIVPLTCDPELSLDDKYASPFAFDVSTTNYGVVHLHPKQGEKKKILVTAQSAFITKGYSAQDHLISKAALVEKQTKILNDSRCVESSQGGYISRTRTNDHVVAPLKLREIALNYVGESGYSKLWPHLASFNKEHGAGGLQNIKDYFSKWNKELDKFIAHFERLDNCIGFITLYDDEVVAIDKFPSFTYASEIWEKLVRDSYAALVIKDRVNKTPISGQMPKVGDISGNSLEDIYNKLVGDRTDHYKTLMAEIIDIDFTTKTDNDTVGSKILKSNGYIGQIIEDNGINIMVSIIKKDSFKPGDMKEARKMRKLARNQQDFAL